MRTLLATLTLLGWLSANAAEPAKPESAPASAKPESAPASAKPTRPNILFCIADDWSAGHAGAYGDRVVKTPSFDRLAREGVLFTRAYCASPSCTPSRGAILTGQAIHRLGPLGNLWSRWPKDDAPVVFPDLLEKAGYRVGLRGKGWGPGDWTASGRASTPAGPTVKDFAALLAATPTDKPFFFWFGSSDPHRSYEKGTGRAAGMDPASVVLPPFWPDTPEVRSDVLDYYFEVQRFDRDVGELLALLEKSGRAENTIVVVTSDNGMPFPRGKANLYDLGTRMPLVVRWPVGVVKPGRSSAAFVGLADLCPTFLEAAGVPLPTGLTARSLLPILASDDSSAAVGREQIFLERERHANVRRGDLSYPSRAVRTEKYMYIRNLRADRWPAGDPELYWAVGAWGDIDPSPTKDAVTALRDAADDRQRRMFELCCGKRPAEELYDLAADPWQTVNLADKPELADVKAGLRAALDKWMADTADPRATPTGGDDRFDKYEYLGGRSDRPAAKKRKTAE